MVCQKPPGHLWLLQLLVPSPFEKARTAAARSGDVPCQLPGDSPAGGSVLWRALFRRGQVASGIVGTCALLQPKEGSWPGKWAPRASLPPLVCIEDCASPIHSACAPQQSGFPHFCRRTLNGPISANAAERIIFQQAV